jgi:hypothetical protein
MARHHTSTELFPCDIGGDRFSWRWVSAFTLLSRLNLGIGEAPEGKADVLEVTGPGNFSARLVVRQDTHLPVMLMWQQPAPGHPLRPNTGCITQISVMSTA